MRKINKRSLYLVITEEYGKDRSALEIARRAIAGGVDMIQMREKNRPRREIIELGKELSNLCIENNVIFIVNDDPEIAREVSAGGVHLGQEDIKKYTVEAARKILGRDKIIGLSTHSIETFRKACLEDVEYIAYGPVFQTKIKDDCVGTDNVGKIAAMTKKPVFFIGGINLENVGSLLEKGARRISLIRAITEADDITAAARNFRQRLDDIKEGT